jgi:hypothetical protein
VQRWAIAGQKQPGGHCQGDGIGGEGGLPAIRVHQRRQEELREPDTDRVGRDRASHRQHEGADQNAQGRVVEVKQLHQLGAEGRDGLELVAEAEAAERRRGENDPGQPSPRGVYAARWPSAPVQAAVCAGCPGFGYPGQPPVPCHPGICIGQCGEAGGDARKIPGLGELHLEAAICLTDDLIGCV